MSSLPSASPSPLAVAPAEVVAVVAGAVDEEVVAEEAVAGMMAEGEETGAPVVAAEDLAEKGTGSA